MINILKGKIEFIENNKVFFKKNLLPIYKKAAFEDKTMSKEMFNKKLEILKNLSSKQRVFEKRLDVLCKLESISKNIQYAKDLIEFNQNICFLSYNTEKASIRVMIVKYQDKFTSEIILEETYEDKVNLDNILQRPFTRFIAFDKRNLFKILDSKKVSYDKNLFFCVQRMSLFYYNDLSTLYKLDKVYEDISIFKEPTDNSLRKIKNIFEGIINFS